MMLPLLALCCLLPAALANSCCPEPPLTNVALRKTATQSSNLPAEKWKVWPSTGEPYRSLTSNTDPSAAVDGNLDTDPDSGGSCSFTDEAVENWLQVDLGDTYLIKSVKITNQKLKYPGRVLKNFPIRVSDTADPSAEATPEEICANVGEGEAVHDQTTEFKCDKPLTGRYVTIKKAIPKAERDDAYNKHYSLVICELQVMGILATDVKPCNVKPDVLLAVDLQANGASSADFDNMKEFAKGLVDGMDMDTHNWKGLVGYDNTGVTTDETDKTKDNIKTMIDNMAQTTD